MSRRTPLFVFVFLILMSCSKEDAKEPVSQVPDFSGITKLLNDSVAVRGFTDEPGGRRENITG